MKSVLSIFLALIITFLLLIIIKLLSLNGFPFFVAIFLGGGIAVWFSTQNRIKHSIYYGLIFAVLYGIHYSLTRGFITALTLIALILISAGMGGYIAKNDKNTIKKILVNKFQCNYKSFFIGLYKRNKMFLIASSVIFFVSVLICSIGPYISSSFNYFLTSIMIKDLSAKTNVISGTTLSIFLNNSYIAFSYDYIGGIFFGIGSILDLIQTGFLTGFIVFKHPFTLFYLLPHGVFEISSMLISTAAGFKLLSVVINVVKDGIHIKRDKPLFSQVNQILNVNYLKFRDSMTLFIIAIFLLAIAAVIEVNISLKFGNYITGLNIHDFAKYMLSTFS